MPAKFLHQHPDFKSLIEIVSREQKIDEPSLVEKDYWIMHSLFGLQRLGLKFELKGGTSLSKGFQVIHRFSEDIDIRIDPDEALVKFKVYTGKNHDKKAHRQSRKSYYDWLAEFIRGKINGIKAVVRDEEYDDLEKFRNGGIRLKYNTAFPPVTGLKADILLETGFDRVTPNQPVDISSWLYNKAAHVMGDSLIDNRAVKVPCYEMGYTFVEKLHAVTRKYRLFKTSGKLPDNFIRHYYDIYQLLDLADVKKFIGTAEYKIHKEERFKGDDTNVSNSEAFLVSDPRHRELLIKQYEKSRALYYKGQPKFETILQRIGSVLNQL